MSLTIRVRVDEAVLIGNPPRRWVLREVVEKNVHLRVEDPSGQLVDLSNAHGVELEPGVIASVGHGEGTARIIFRADRSIPIIREEFAEESGVDGGNRQDPD